MSMSTCNGKCGVLSLTFNQDCSCVAIASQQGLRIYNLASHKVCYKDSVGAVSVMEMLFCTSLIAFAGAGEQPALTPRKLTILNTATHKVILALKLQTSVLACRMNRHRLAVVLERKAQVYDLHNLELLRTLDTSDNPKGVCALGSSSEPNYLALPASSTTGMLRVYDLAQDGGNVLCELEAHKTPLEVMAWNSDSSLLASASHKGTVIRVHRLPQATKAYTFRRGTYPATIHSLAFSPAGIEPQLLCASSSHGTLHLFRLEPQERHPAAVAASAAAGLLSAVMKYSVSDMVEPPRNIATVRLPTQNVPAICGILPPKSSPTPTAQQQESSRDTESVVVIAATLDGQLYEYAISDLKSPHGPRCVLEGEYNMLGDSSTSPAGM